MSVRGAPQRMAGRERLWVRDVQGGVQSAGHEFGEQGVGIHDGTLETFTGRDRSGMRARSRASTRPRVSSVSGTVTITTSAWGNSPDSSSTAWTGPRGVERALWATRRNAHSKGAIRSSIAVAMEP
jgi:hypothetical protein